MDSVNEAALLALMERTKYPMLQVSSELHFTTALGSWHNCKVACYQYKVTVNNTGRYCDSSRKVHIESHSRRTPFS